MASHSHSHSLAVRVAPIGLSILVLFSGGASGSEKAELVCGNIDGDIQNETGLEDWTLLIKFVFSDSSLPGTYGVSDVNLCPPVDISDVTYFQRFLFESGPAPCSSLSSCSSIVAGLISLDSVSGSPAPGKIQAGVPVSLWMTISNQSNVNVTGSCNGFVISSPDSATWWPTLRADTIIIDPPPPAGYIDSMWYNPLLDPPEYPGVTWNGSSTPMYNSIEIRTHANRGPGAINPPQVGQGADTVFIVGSIVDQEIGIFAGFESPALAFRIDSVSEASVGKTICIDTVSIASRDRWKWAGWTGSQAIDLYPNWSGQQCFEIVSCCQGMRGNVNFDLQGTIDISDLTSLVGWMFRSGNTPPCMLEADIDANGTHEISDLTYLVGYMFKSGPPPTGCP